MCTAGDLAKLVTISKESHDHNYAIKINEDYFGEIKIQNANVILPLPVVQWVWFPLLPRVRSEGKSAGRPAAHCGLISMWPRNLFSNLPR